jgi:transglutaminase-like putative cysteine protease
MKKLLILIIFLILPIQVSAKNITSPQMVSEMKVNITEKGSIESTGNVYSLELNLSIPQEDSYQHLETFDARDSYGPCKTDSCSYSFVYDTYGNKILNIRWKNPPNIVNYTVNSIFTIYRRNDVDKKILKEFIEPTKLVQSTDPEIADLASKARGNDFEKVAYLSKWIGENIEYDKVYSDVSLSAKEILEVRKGVCKEFSNLLVSFLRNLGYYSAVDVGYVYPGNIYNTNEFQPHGWTEVYTGNGIIADPTWSEVGYLDATHVKFATFPDSSWTITSANSNGVGEIKVKLSDTDVKLNILDFKEEPIMSSNTSLLANNIWSGYAVLKTDLKSDRCLLTKIDYKSCIDENSNDFLKLVDYQNIVYFCNEKSVFAIFKIPNLDESRSYKCYIKVLPYGGTESGEQLSLNSKSSGYSKLTVEKSVLKPGEKFLASALNSQIFTDYGEYGYEKAEFTAPNYDFKVYSYNVGYLDSKNISVLLKEPFAISLDINETAYVGKPTIVKIKVVNLLNVSQNIKVTFMGDYYSDTLIDSKEFVFNFTSKSVDDNLVQVFVNTPDFSTSVAKTITVIGQKDILESLWKPIIDFFKWLFSLFRVNL